MGLIVADEHKFSTGLTITNYYVNVNDIAISKSNLPDFKYSVVVRTKYYVSHDARISNKEEFMENRIVMITDVLDNLYDQIYTEIKTKFENYTDCI